MSALSVLSSIVPTVPGGTASASPETAASDGLFAGMVAAVAPSTAPSMATTSGEGDALSDIPAAEPNTVEAPAQDVAAAPAWPPLPLIAPAPPPVAPNTAADAADAGVSATPSPSAPLPTAPTLDAAPVAPPAAEASAPPAEDLPAAPSPAKAPVTPAAPLGAEQVDPAQVDKTAEPIADRAPPRPVTAESRSTPTSAQLTTPASGDVTASRPAPSSTSGEVGVEADQPRQEVANQTRPASAASPQVTATATRSASPSVAATSQTQAQAQPESIKALTETPRVETAQPEQTAQATMAPTPRPQTPASMPTQPVAVPPAETADAPKQMASTPSVPSDVEGEAAQSKGQPAQQAAPATAAAPTAPVLPAPTRNNAARLDDRPSNAASSGAPTDAKGDALNGARSAPSAVAAQATTPAAPALGDHAAAKPVVEVEAAPLDTGAAPDQAPSQQVLDAQNAAPAASRDLGLSQLSRATVETTAQIAAQILKKLDGRSTRFDMALTPDDLGRVDVSMEIDSDGRLTARLAFDNPAAATDLRSRADELRRQLQDAGFQLTQDSLEFSERNPSSGFGGGGAFDRAPDRRAFAGAARLAAEADTALPAPGAWASLSQTRDRVDLKV